MICSPVLDVGWVAVLMLVSLSTFLLMIPVTLLVEGFALMRFLMVRGWRLVRDVVVMNLASGLVGAIGLVLAGSLGGIAGGLTGEAYYEASQSNQLLFVAVLLMVSEMASVVIEGAVLTLLERERSARQVWLAALISNGLSYMFLTAVLFLRILA